MTSNQTTYPLPPITVRLPPDHPDGDRIMWDWCLAQWVTLDGVRKPSAWAAWRNEGNENV